MDIIKWIKKNKFKDIDDDLSSVKSTKNVLRGLHFQKDPFAQSKLEKK